MTTNKTFTYEEIFANKKNALFVTAHPDDIDVFFAGTIALLRKNNVACNFLVLTSGDLAGSGKDREIEQLKSLSFVGITEKNIEFARLKDGFLENNHETIAVVVKAIRKWQPEIVATFDPRTLIIEDKYIMHRDHRNCGQVTVDAVYPYARVADYHPELGKDFKVGEVFLCDPFNKNTEINISDVIETKRQMLSPHLSQWSKNDIESILQGNNKGGVFSENFGYVKLDW